MEQECINKGWIVRNSISTVGDQVQGEKQIVSKKVDLPYDGMIHTVRDKQNTTGSDLGYFTPEDYVYTKQLMIGDDQKGNDFFVKFDGVFGITTVQINNQVVGHHNYGYGSFLFKITDYVKVGKLNEIKIIVRNRVQPASRWYTGSGVFDNVFLITLKPLDVLPDKLQISTVGVNNDVATLSVKVAIHNHYMERKTLFLQHEIFDEAGHLVTSRKQKLNLKSQSNLSTSTRLYLNHPNLWSADSPYLYHCVTTLLVGNEKITMTQSNFGIRTLSLDPVNGLQVNNKTVKLKGGCIHPDNGLLGAVNIVDDLNRKVQLLKSAGYNALRSAHNSMSPELLEACDRYGLYVIDEFADTWTQSKTYFDYSVFMDNQWADDLQSMVLKDYNHPSIIFYSIGNEIPETGTNESAFWAIKFIDKIRSLDQTRYITNVINPTLSNMDKLPQITESLKTEIPEKNINDIMHDFKKLMPVINTHPITSEAISESADLVDVVGYNYAAARYELDHKDYPNRVFIGTETNPRDLDNNWKQVVDTPYVLGDFSWTAWDYLGEVGLGRMVPDTGHEQFLASYPWLISCSGDFDITGYRKPVSYWRETIWDKENHKPYIAVRNPKNFGEKMFISNWSWTDSKHSWTWPGSENQATSVEVYSNADEVELFLNNHSLGRNSMSATRRNYFVWNLNYVPGVLKAISYCDGRAVGSSVLSTVRGQYDLVTETHSYGSLRYVDIYAEDSNGTLDMNAIDELTVTGDERVTILAFGTGNPKPLEKMSDLTHPLFDGHALIIVKMEDGHSDAQISVKSNAFKTKVVSFKNH